jgi:hypothetical protein
MSDELLRHVNRHGRYLPRELIGQGGMGKVYRAWDKVLRRDVAVKMLTAPDDDMLKRFEREAAAIARLKNHHVVEIYDLCADAPHPYIVMEYLRGECLEARLRHGPLSVEEAVEIILGVCCAVNACHRVGIVHRDLKPGNVFLSQTADHGVVVKVLDFGVAKPMQMAPADDVTSPGKVVGTPRYLAPEHLRGGPTDQLGDQYQVGVLLYVCLTGKQPFCGKENGELVRAILMADYPTLRGQRSDVPVALEQVVPRAMAADRAARFPSVLALARALVPHASEPGRVVWKQVFESCDEAPSGRENGDTSGSVTRVETPLHGLETTLLVRAEEVAALAGQSRAAGSMATPVEIAQQQPLDLMGPATRIESAESESMSVVRAVPTTRQRIVESRRGLFVVLVAAVGIGSVTAFLFAKHHSYASPTKWSPMILPVTDAGAGARGADAHDAGADGTKPLKVAPEGQDSPKENQAATRRESAVDESKQKPAQDPEKKLHSKKSRRVEYTPEGSPILW